MPVEHVPVLCDSVVEWLRAAAPGLLVDVTLGLGGHAAALLDAEPGFRLLGIDRDPEAVSEARRRLHGFADRVEIVTAAFADLPRLLEATGNPRPSALLADLGCSSLQLDRPERGFSFQVDGPLDMRMDRSGPTAADLVNQSPEEDLVTVLRDFGEERHARRIARAVAHARQSAPIRSTVELSRIVERAIGYSAGNRIHPATRTFQALRIAVNRELDQLAALLEPALRRLASGGRMAVISFHSLEDRLVKHTFRRLEGHCVCPPDFPKCTCNPERLVKVLTRRAVRPDEEEIAANPRSRSARLRVVERLPEAA